MDDNSYVAGRERMDLTMKIINKNPSIVTDHADRTWAASTTFWYNTSWYTLIASFPASFYLTRKMAKDPKLQGRYLAMNTGMSTFALVFFFWGLWNQGKMEEALSKKYLGHYHIDQLKAMESGQLMGGMPAPQQPQYMQPQF